MGGAFADGLLRSQAFKPADITLANPSQAKLERFAAQGTSVTTNNQAAVAEADITVLAVKPWLVEGVITEIGNSIKLSHQCKAPLTRPIIINFAAGVRGSQLKEWLTTALHTPANDDEDQKAAAALFTVIPNIAIAQCNSMTFIAPIDATKEETEVVKRIFDELGEAMVTDEKHLTAGTVLASCGIAYAMRYIRAAAEGGVELGFRAGEAQQIVMQTIKGAVSLLEETGMHPEQAIDLVTTPGGITIRGLNEMEHAGFTSAVVRGLKAGMH